VAGARRSTSTLIRDAAGAAVSAAICAGDRIWRSRQRPDRGQQHHAGQRGSGEAEFPAFAEHRSSFPLTAETSLRRRVAPESFSAGSQPTGAMMGAMKVLVVEDDVRMAAAIRRGLRFEGLVVDVAVGGEQALRMVGATEYDAVVLDVMMPGVDGFETCRRMRADGFWVPVLMLTARDAVDDRVRGLDGGADDYLTKPFSLAELTARLRALVRRGPVERPTVLEAGDLRLDPATHEVSRGEVQIELSAREFTLLESLMRHPGQVFTQRQLLEAAWDMGYEQRSNVVEVYVRYLREKIDRPFGLSSIETVRGAGYRLRRDGGT